MDDNHEFDQSGLDPVLGRGCYTRELATALKQLGFRTGNVWTEIPARAAKDKLDEEFAKLHADLAAGIPSIVCMHYDSRPGTTEHFRLVLGYDARTDEVVYHEPAEKEGAYRRMARAEFLGLWPLFGSKPHTPFGYFSDRHGALVMNISTGGGTLVHEIVHPFMASNFPECPSWFNEGLASLYEQAAEQDGHIIGQTNWRLAGLQKAIRKGTVPAFETLCGTSTGKFYDRDPGTNYSQARYLCYYLQEHGLLVKFYHAFRKNAATDRTGYKTLLSILDEDDADAFRKTWEKFVLGLLFE